MLCPLRVRSLILSPCTRVYAAAFFRHDAMNRARIAAFHGAATGVEVVFVEGSGKEVRVLAKLGESLLQVAHRHGVDMEGACEASVACSTCHVVLPRDVFDSLPEASEKEEDMLDQAPGLTMTCVRANSDGFSVCVLD
jgi:2Fe-2S ferredoxin